jgi:hypothetical protein
MAAIVAVSSRGSTRIAAASPPVPRSQLLEKAGVIRPPITSMSAAATIIAPREKPGARVRWKPRSMSQKAASIPTITSWRVLLRRDDSPARVEHN